MLCTFLCRGDIYTNKIMPQREVDVKGCHKIKGVKKYAVRKTIIIIFTIHLL